MRNLPPLPALRVFEAAARHGSFTRAADELGLTQAGVSYQVKLLEERIGAPLFVRRARDVVLTELGRHFAGPATQALDLLATAYTTARNDGQGVLTITALHIFASNWLAPRLGEFQIAHPGIAVRLDVSSRLVDFTREDVDVGIRGREEGGGDWPGLTSHKLFTWQFTPMCSPAFLERSGPIESPKDLLRLPLLSADDPWWSRWFTLAGHRSVDLPIQTGIRTELQQIQGNAAIAGQGVALLSPLLWHNELVSGRLIQLFPIIGTTSGGMWLVYPDSHVRSRKVRLFRDWILSEFQKLPISVSGRSN